jgi:hypothetical protein
VVFAEDASRLHTGNASRVMAALRNLATGKLRMRGAGSIAKISRAIRDAPEHAVWIGASPAARSSRELVAALLVSEEGLAVYCVLRTSVVLAGFRAWPGMPGGNGLSWYGEAQVA